MSKRVDSGENLLGSFPYSLSRDDDKNKVAESIADDLAKTVSDTEMAKIFPAIDSLPEAVLDMLAFDLKVEWYEYNAPIKNKRITIKECILVHKHKGTKFAVQTAVHSLYDRADVQEWFEYSGEPFHFRIKVYGSSSGGIKTLGQKILYAKNLRSVLDSVAFVLIPESDLNAYVGMVNAALKKNDKAEIVSDDETIFSTQAVEIFAGTMTDGIAKRTCADMQIVTDYGTAIIELAAKAGIAVRKAKRLCGTTQLCQKAPSSLQSAMAGIKTSAATLGAMSKRISAVIYQHDQTAALNALGSPSAGVAADGISKKIKVEVKQL